jgi:hypothetical protein
MSDSSVDCWELPTDPTPGSITIADNDDWKNNFGSSISTSGEIAAISEPTGVWLIIPTGTWLLKLARQASVNQDPEILLEG